MTTQGSKILRTDNSNPHISAHIKKIILCDNNSLGSKEIQEYRTDAQKTPYRVLFAPSIYARNTRFVYFFSFFYFFCADVRNLCKSIFSQQLSSAQKMQNYLCENVRFCAGK